MFKNLTHCLISSFSVYFSKKLKLLRSNQFFFSNCQKYSPTCLQPHSMVTLFCPAPRQTALPSHSGSGKVAPCVFVQQLAKTKSEGGRVQQSSSLSLRLPDDLAVIIPSRGRQTRQIYFIQKSCRVCLCHPHIPSLGWDLSSKMDKFGQK